MKHINCGGTIVESWNKTYEYEGMEIPAYYCQKCGKEILGDIEIELTSQIF